MSRKYWLGLFLTAVLLLFAGNDALDVTDSVEANYALTAKEMVLSGDWLSPQIFGRYWFDKPIFFYWLTALGFKIFGFTEFGARFFPAVFGLGSLGLLAYGGKRLYNERIGWLSTFILLTSVEFFLISKSIITDSVLFFFFSSVLLFFYLAYKDNKAKYWYIMYISAGLAVLTKGPVGVLLPGLIVVLFLLWQRDWQIIKRCHLFSGLLLFGVVSAPWYVAMYMLHGSDFINTFFGVHNYLRATVSEHPRDNVVYYYTLVNILALFPWSLLIPWLVWKKVRQHDYHIDTREGFLLIWTVVVFLFFQTMATKYITYTYPLLFPAALLLGNLLDKYGEECFFRGYKFLFGSFIGILLAVAWWCGEQRIISASVLYFLPMGLFIGVLGYGLLQYVRHSQVIGIGVICLCFYISLIFGIAIPLAQHRSAKNIGLALTKSNVTVLGAYGSYPTSAVFYSNATIYKLLNSSDVEEYKPHTMSWSSKNVMPYKVLDDGVLSKVAVKRKRLQDFYAVQRDSWQILGCYDDWILLEQKNS